MRLVSFNTLHGRSLEDGRVDLDRYAAAVRALDADVLALQEVDRAQPRSHRADLTAIAAEAMGAVDHRFAPTLRGRPGIWRAAAGGPEPRGACYGLALLSRLPVLDWEVVVLSRRNRFVAVRRSGWRWRLVREEPRVAVVAVVETPDGPLTVANTHLTILHARARQQLTHLVARLADRPRPLVLLGDLNLRGGLPAQLTGLRPLATVATYPVAAPTAQIDHALADGSLRATTEPRAVDTGLSDHRALVLDVTRS